MNNKQTISVVIPNYNYEQYIGEALEAILSQSYSPKEVIVVDDGSTDESVAVIKGFMNKYPNLLLIQNEKNMGIMYSVNRGLNITTGEYILFTASDDRIFPGLFEKSMNILEQYPQAGFCCSDNVLLIGDKYIADELHLSDKPCYFNPAQVARLFKEVPFVPYRSNSVIVKKSAFISAGGYNPELKWSCDTFNYNIICFRQGFCYLPEKLAALRLHSDQFGRTMLRNWHYERVVIRKMIDLLKRPKYQDVFPLFKRAAPFSISPWEVLRVVLAKRKYRDYLSFKLVWFAIIDRIIRSLKTIIPYHYVFPFINMGRKLRAKFR